MWKSEVESIQSGKIHKFSFFYNTKKLLYKDVVVQWQHDEGFRRFFLSEPENVPHPAYFWEVPPVTKITVTKPFEFVLVDSPQLAGLAPNPTAFESYFKEGNKNQEIATFPNIRKDAWLVVPCPQSSMDAYPHIAAFVRKAPTSQKHALWQIVGRTIEQQLHERPIWLSTSGLGVAWLHIRLDTYPKYYTYTPYKDMIHR
ncbi:hypothetical protein KFU94_03070 [Chloroflexi bacterium TSY]|nr:hypothetical protein [Chloroflexi bacterium TSY]